MYNDCSYTVLYYSDDRLSITYQGFVCRNNISCMSFVLLSCQISCFYIWYNTPSSCPILPLCHALICCLQAESSVLRARIAELEASVSSSGTPMLISICSLLYYVVCYNIFLSVVSFYCSISIDTIILSFFLSPPPLSIPPFHQGADEAEIKATVIAKYISTQNSLEVSE